jgi:hypothetical protein
MSPRRIARRASRRCSKARRDVMKGSLRRSARGIHFVTLYAEGNANEPPVAVRPFPISRLIPKSTAS